MHIFFFTNHIESSFVTSMAQVRAITGISLRKLRQVKREGTMGYNEWFIAYGELIKQEKGK